jgi:hypothetical protein
MLVNELLSGFPAAAAAGTEPPALRQVGEVNGAVFHRFADLAVGDGLAETYVHGWNPNAR